LERFVVDYVETVGGVSEEIEPQVYDLLLPPSEANQAEELRIAFDSEALPEHPGAQLASYGTPLVDRLLRDALARGRFAELFLTGLNLQPYGVEELAARSLQVPPGFQLAVFRRRSLLFPQAIFWFQATFISDQKEQEALPLGIDLHYGRQVRHLDRLLGAAGLVDQPAESLPEIPGMILEQAYRLARQESLRTVGSLANVRAREMQQRTDRQIERMTQYYADLRRETEEDRNRAEQRGDAVDKFLVRQQALAREQQLRISELRQKSTLAVQMRLLNMLLVRQPKLLLHCEVLPAKRPGAKQPVSSTPLVLVWDPLIESLEAVPCPACLRPTFELKAGPTGDLGCPNCVSTAAATQRRR
jgi:hypothetical protein